MGLAVSAVAGLMLLAATPALAQPTDAEVATAQGQYEAGLELMEQALYAEALQRFQASYDLMEGHPNQPLILFQIGRAHQAMGARCRSIDAYERFLETGRQDYRADAERRLANVRAEAEAAGLDCQGGGISPVGPLLLIGGGLVALGGLVTGILALNANDRLATVCTEERVCPPSEQGLIDEHGAFVVATDALLISAAVLVSAGLVLTLLLREGPGEDASAIALGGACGPEGCVLVAGGSF
jgi:tetratricopeptide (TPR) repeat protein